MVAAFLHSSQLCSTNTIPTITGTVTVSVHPPFVLGGCLVQLHTLCKMSVVFKTRDIYVTEKNAACQNVVFHSEAF